MEPSQMQGQAKPRTTPKDFFLYVLVMVMLYTSIIALINLLFTYINFVFPDALYTSIDSTLSSVRWGMALLFIIFPTYLLGTWYINRDLRMNPDKEVIGIRKWLTFLALFLAALAILTDLSVLIYTFLGGEVTMRFTLKVLAVLVVAVFGLSYYVLDLRGRIRANKNLGRLYGIVAGVAIVASIIGGFLIVGTPAEQRSLRFDAQRLQDLQNIQWQVVTYWQQRQVFPKALSDLNDPISNFTVPTDPTTGESYQYKTGGGLTFSLCATFERSGSGSSVMSPYAQPMGMAQVTTDSWSHPAGNYCFDRTIDPSRYPPIDKTPAKI